jgi:Tfp pilus assembly pilus retraction ATPase PilT
MRSGERPHVLAGEHRLDVASAVLSSDAVEALIEQILSPSARRELALIGSVSEPVESSSFPDALSARAERSASRVSIELIVSIGLESLAPSQLGVMAQAPAEPVSPQADATEPECAAAESTGLELHRGSPSQVFAWIQRAASLGATTVYVRSGSPAVVRIDDRIVPLDQVTVEAADVENASQAFNHGGDGLWERREDGEWVHEHDELGWIGCREFTDLQGSGLVIRLRPAASSRLLHKYIPRQIRTACEGEGLVVIAASTQADVEAFAAAVADWSSRHRGGYVVSLQQGRRSPRDIAGDFVSQRSIAGADRDLAVAIEQAAQECPDILLVTPLEAGPSAHAAVLAAAGRLVIAGVVAPSAADALQILAGANPDTRQALVRSFRAALGCLRVRRLGGGRTVIREVVVAGVVVRTFLEAGDFDGLNGVQSRVAGSMRSLDESLASAVLGRRISLREAVHHAVDRRRLVALVRGRHLRR